MARGEFYAGHRRSTRFRTLVDQVRDNNMAAAVSVGDLSVISPAHSCRHHMYPVISNAIRELRTLRLVYEWGERLVEPHAYGVGSENQELLRAYQVGGASQSGDAIGWKLFRVDEIRSLAVAGTFPGPRHGYRRDDAAMTKAIYAQL
jgi:hypothetical protein